MHFTKLVFWALSSDPPTLCSNKKCEYISTNFKCEPLIGFLEDPLLFVFGEILVYFSSWWAPFGCFVRDKEDLNRLTGPKDFFAHSVRIKLASPQAALLSFSFSLKVKTSCVVPPRGTWLRTHHWLKECKEKRKRREKSPDPFGSGNQTWDLSIRSLMHYHLNYHHGQLAQKMFSSVQKMNSRWMDSNPWHGDEPRWNYLLSIKNL